MSRHRSNVAWLLWCCPVLLVLALWQRMDASPAALDDAQASGQPANQTTPSGLVPAAALSAQHRTIVEKYCVTCHNDRAKTGGLSLQPILGQPVEVNAAIWEKVILKVSTGAMPPAGMPRPELPMATAFVNTLAATLDAAAAANPQSGHASLHRLNRIEYANAVRDLLALDIDGAALLPADDVAYGFDNIADLLTMSPADFERYMSAARKIARLAVGDTDVAAASSVYTYPDIPPLEVDNERPIDLPPGAAGGFVIRHHFPLDADYIVKVRARSSRPVEVRLDDAKIGGLELERPLVEDQEAAPPEWREIPVTVRAGTRTLSFVFTRARSAQEGVGPSYSVGGQQGGRDVDLVEVAGPFKVAGPGDTPSRERIFVCRPTEPRQEGACAKTILEALARRAYRRPATSSDVDALMTFYEAARKEGAGFDSGIQRALERVLVSPDFLFRIPSVPSVAAARATTFRISDIDLASQLSFFLWSSPPDEALLEAAERGALRDPAILEQHVRRMLADPRADALVENFAGQWLYLRTLDRHDPDPYRYPEWDNNLRRSMRRETELLIRSQVRQDSPIPELLSTDYTYLNERLARHYRIPNVVGTHFRRVPLADARRRGLLGQSSVLTVSSYAHRTSVVVRGKWVLENILGAPPPAPPPNIPALEENSGKAAPKSLRTRMEQHRANPVCASCHSRMDPIGFALENFDAIGGWRNRDEGLPIDASGTFADGTAFNGPAELSAALAGRREEFVRTVTTKMLTYATGRGLEYYDQPAIRQIMREAATRDYRWSSIILGIVKSAPFQTRTRTTL